MESNKDVSKQPIKATVSPSPKPRRKRRPPAIPWKKPADMPKRPLSAYNLFFKEERERMLKAGYGSKASLSGGGSKSSEKSEQPITIPKVPDPKEPRTSSAARKHARSSGIGFANLAKLVAAKWKDLDPKLKAPFEEVAAKEKERYRQQMVEWRAQQQQKKEEEEGNGHFSPLMSESSGMQQPGQVASHQSSEKERKDAEIESTRSTIHIFGAPPRVGPGDSGPSITLTPQRKERGGHLRAEENQQSESSPMTPSAGHGVSSDAAFHPAHRYYMDYERPKWEGYEHHNQYHYGGFDAAYASHFYQQRGRETHGVEQGHPPLIFRQMSLPGYDSQTASPYPSISPRSEYGDAYVYPPPYFVPGNPHMHPAYSPQLQYAPRPHPMQQTPYPYGFFAHHPHGPPRLHEETLQLQSPRGRFQTRQSSPRQQRDRRQAPNQVRTSAQGSQSSEHEECSLLESSFEHIDNNLDTDTVDFLTKLELE